MYNENIDSLHGTLNGIHSNLEEFARLGISS